MKTKRTLVMLMVLVMVLVASCHESSDNLVTTVEIAIEDRSMDSRTMMPAPALLDIHKYSISGQGPSGRSFGPVVSSERSVTITDVSVGRWTIQATALNAENRSLASGSGSFDIGRGLNSIVLALDSIPGYGTLSINLSWDDDMTLRESVHIDVSIEDGQGNVVSTVARESDTSSQGIALMLPLPAGCYIMSITASDEDGSLEVGATEAIRIVADTLTAGSLHLQPSNSNFTGNLSIGLENRIGVPMPFYLDYLPKNVSSGQSVTLRAVHGTLDAAISESSLHYSWFKDGNALPVGDNATCVVNAQVGLHRYDVIVTSNIEGTMSGASLLLNVSD